ncbi:hypothetical protein Desdi_2069 [Desulfitobacterium dichloroeliminans LMG P-21439]|uniref:Uncharacterized protein n=1 Tax=Desulfitobacterium dichloroeliminans (strain LMG P-21439 / DCA1) TaxID=871963 RepID=L0F8L3_DESDL|nr:hypothetical protein [Desulfitobacterium dichloroeliminans]AGA69512.1 hypothetical protein Desdi_2069 [Desulfitobacterium dichloroeliminans LMG P-21439]
MLFQWIMGFVALGALIVLLASDRWSSKSKHSSYYEQVKKPSGKEARLANLPDTSTNDKFYSKLNAH